MTLRGLALPFVLVAAFSSWPAAAGRARSWSASSAAELAAGTLDGTVIDEQGRLRLAPELETLWGPEPGIVWDLGSTGDDGAFVGLSSPARLLRVAPRQDPVVWFETGEGLIAAVLPDQKGGVYFGLSPRGRLYHARSPREATELGATNSEYIWALDATPDGSIWIGTGQPGLVLRQRPSGELVRVFDAGDDPVRSLLALEDGTVFAGTGGQGRVIRIDPAGKPFVLMDADETEIVSLAATSGGELFALAARGAKQVSSSAMPQIRGPVETVRVTASAPEVPEPVIGEAEQQGETAPLRPSPQRITAPTGAVLYRITPAGDARRVWEAANEVPFTLAASGDGGVLVATGDDGRVWRVDERGRASVLATIPSEQASAMAWSGAGSVLIGGTTDARVERLGPDLRRVGSYLTPPVDAGAPADWGRVGYEAELPRGARLEAFVRAGNTSEPDETWTEWQALRGPGGDAPVDLQAARWLQARFDLRPAGRGESPSVRRIELFYRTRNRQPAIEELTVHPAGVVWTRSPVQSMQTQGPAIADDPVARETVESLAGMRMPRPVRKSYELGARTVAWRGSDPDGDILQYRVEVRAEGSETWVPLARNLDEEFLGFDTRGLPDGHYRMRLTVDDGRDNPGGASLSDREESAIFTVDNTRPAVQNARIGRERAGHALRFVAADAGGRVATVEIAVDGGGWQPIDPEDGVADSAEEVYEIFVGPADPGKPAEARGDEVRTVRVRVTDSAGNLGGDAWPLD